jgi:TPR repeat protein
MRAPDVRTLTCALAFVLAGTSAAQESPDVARLRAAADKGDATAQSDLGLLYVTGNGVRRDPEAARALFEASARQGDRVGQYRLALMYDSGDGVQQDFAKAVALYRLSVAQGYAPAQNNLANLHAAGFGVPEDHVEAVRLYRLAAAQGDLAAQDNLGNAYATGEGVPPDNLRAYLWLTVAFEGGLRGSDISRQEIAAFLTPGQRAAAASQAATCRASNFQECGEPDR